MRKFLFLLLAAGLLYPVLSFATGVKPPKKFGDIDKHNLELLYCPIDSSAPAYYIFDWGEAYFDFNTGDIMLLYHARIKIVNSKGFSRGNVTLSYAVNDPIKHLKAATYNLVDGKIEVTRVDNSMIFKEKVIEDERKMKISFPDIRDGSIIEYSYLKNAGDVYNLVPWTFQSDIPVLYSEFNLRIPDQLQYKFISDGYETVDDFTRKGFVDRGTVQSTEYHWVMRNIPALKEEPYMPPLDNYYSRLSFELSSITIPGKSYQEISKTWKGVEKELKENTSFYLMPDQWKFLKDSATALTDPDNDLNTIRAIHGFIGRHVKWDGTAAVFASNTASHTYKAGSGNTADINLMLIGLLRQAGFSAYPVILSTRDNGIIRNHKVPVLSKFNYTMAWARKDGREYLLDATQPLLHPAMIPPVCVNGKGRVISDSSHWVSLDQPLGYSESLLYNFKVDGAGTLTGKMNISRKGYKAFAVRKFVEEQGRDKLLEKRKSDHGDWDISAWKLKNEKDPSLPLLEEITCTINGKITEMGDILVLNPLIDPEWKENPFKEEKRIFPVDFLAPRVKKSILIYTLPEGYTVDELPKSLRISTPDKMITYTYAAQTRGNMVQILSSLVIKKAVFNQDEYSGLKSFFNEVLSKQAEQIILKKKEG